MLRIVEVHAGQSVSGEYIVLQNQGLTTQSLRGWVLCADSYLHGDPAAVLDAMFIFTQDVPIKPYMRVVLFTGRGESGWYSTVDGKRAYVVYWGRTEKVWSAAGVVHLLQPASSQRIVHLSEKEAPARR
jgi:hypothetical protein